MNIEQEILTIKERNQRVGLDKAWETSWARRIFISAITYLFAVLWLRMLGELNLWFKAVVPVAGFLLSTLSLPLIKRWWISNLK